MKHVFTRTSKLADYVAGAVLVLMPFHAFLTVWGSTLVGHYTLLRLWDDIAVAILLGLAAWWLIGDAALRRWLSGSLLMRLIVAYGGLTLLLGGISWLKGDVTTKALGYGLLVNLRFLVWFSAVLLAAQRSAFLRRHWLVLLLCPAAIVAFFATLQYTVLPHNFLAHFGYNVHTTITPIETINHDPHYIRVQSTLRGANPLGAYLVLVVTALAVLFVRGRRKVVWATFGAVVLGALYASGSRSAWIGSLLSLGVVVWLALKTRRARLITGAASLLVLAAAASTAVVFRGNVGLQNELLHTQQHSAVHATSNAAHASALRTGLSDVLHQPFGDGPGSAGPASQYNAAHGGPRIAENYYVQIAQETGWLGLALFVSIVVLVAVELYKQIDDSRLALTLLAALIGISFVNFLSHAWTDDTLAFVWWGLAGVALAGPEPSKHEV